VVLSTFTAQYMKNKPTLYWETQSEQDNVGWNIYRNSNSDFSSSTKINPELIPGHGNTSEPNYYNYFDNCDSLTQNTTYSYWLESIDLSGKTHVYNNVANVTIPHPGQNQGYSLPQNYELKTAPNPMYNNTNFRFTLDQDAFVEIYVYDIRGKLLKKLPRVFVEKNETEQLPWNGRDANGNGLSSGIYLYKFNANGKTIATKKLIMMK